MQASQLKPYSIGIVASNKPLGSWDIDVTPIEEMTKLDGEINADERNETIDSQNQDGTAYQVKLSRSAALKATWLPMGNGNRHTPPDVRRGAEVILWRMADSPKLFWMTLKDDMALRKLETVVFAFSATKNESDGVNKDTMYFFEVSTHKKLIHLHTSKRNGEPYGYDIQINTDEGFIKFKDDAGNWIVLDSREKQIAVKNADGSYFEINKKNATLKVPGTFTIDAKNMIEKVAQSIVTKAMNVSTSASNGIQQDAKRIVTQGSASISIASPKTTVV